MWQPAVARAHQQVHQVHCHCEVQALQGGREGEREGGGDKFQIRPKAFTIVHGFGTESEILIPAKKRKEGPIGKDTQEEQNGTNFSSIAPSSEELWVHK